MANTYRVGMQRAAQRYIAPDEIYDDMRSGPSVELPRQFPFSWNPVNGIPSLASLNGNLRVTVDHDVGSLADYSYAAHRGMSGVGNLADDFLRLINPVVDETKKVVADRGANVVEDFIRSTAGGKLLDAVEAKAAEGVTKVVKKQAPNLILLAVAGGAVGGVISNKLGKTGVVIALGAAVYAVSQLLKAAEVEKKK